MEKIQRKKKGVEIIDLLTIALTTAVNKRGHIIFKCELRGYSLGVQKRNERQRNRSYLESR